MMGGGDWISYVVGATFLLLAPAALRRQWKGERRPFPDSFMSLKGLWGRAAQGWRWRRAFPSLYATVVALYAGIVLAAIGDSVSSPRPQGFQVAAVACVALFLGSFCVTVGVVAWGRPRFVIAPHLRDDPISDEGPAQTS